MTTAELHQIEKQRRALARALDIHKSRAARVRRALAKLRRASAWRKGATA